MGKPKAKLFGFMRTFAILAQLVAVIVSQKPAENKQVKSAASYHGKTEALGDESALRRERLENDVIPQELQETETEIQSKLTGQSPVEKQTSGDSFIAQDLQGFKYESEGKLTKEIPVVSQVLQDSQDSLTSLLLDNEEQDKLFAREDVNVGLMAAGIDAVATVSPLMNTTILDKMKAILKYGDVFSDVSALDSFDWFSEEESPLSKSRRRRASEPYHYRRFQQPLRAYLPENVPIGTTVLEVPRNYDAHLEIVYPANTPFRVNSKTGVIITTKLLDYEKQDMYTLILRDAEKANEGSPFYSHDVIVYLNDVNDNAPAFNMESYTGNVNSRGRVGSPVAQLNATDKDRGSRGNIGFLVDDRHSPFTVNPITWVLETNGQPLDQSLTQYPVYVKTFDQGYPRQESARVLIGVNKANSPPEFSETAYTITFSEKVLPGVIIGRVMARSLSNIPVGYEIVPTSDVFAINARGELSLKQSVSNSGRSVITVEASELTDDKPLSSRVLVTLVYTKANENPTIFSEAVYKAEVDEDVSPGILVLTVSVTDCDCNSNCQCTGNQIQFDLVGANDYFSVNEAGEVRTVKNFDYIVQSVFHFMVIAQDNLGNENGQVPAHAYVQVTLRDVNNNAPKFTETRYVFVIDEDSGVGHFVGVVQATDDDVTGAPLAYTMKSDDSKNGSFAIVDQRFGIITLSSSLKYDAQSRFTLVVEASDGVLKSEATVEVVVADVNDNAPQFTVCPDFARIEENLSAGARVAILKAEDKDRGLNAQVEYFIETSYDLFSDDHVELFKVNNRTGEVETADLLDRETKSHYFLIVSAKDQSSDSDVRQIGYCQFLINVEDENDNFPVFEVARYQTSVMENVAVGSKILVVEAIDADIGINAEITYSIDGGDSFLAVNSNGVVTVKSSLVGQLGMKTIKITATNTQPYKGEGTPGQTQKTTVEIFVTDQSLPKFMQLFYKTEVREDVLVGTVVLNVTAIPSTSFAEMIYYMADMYSTSDTQFPFNVDHSTGLIELATGLDFETRQVYTFSVNAHEIGRTEMVEASVEITVVDVNDEAPIFGRGNYDATVSEDAQIGSTVIRIRATDQDPENVQISYEIQPYEDSHLFSLKTLSTSVELLTNAKFDREDKEYYSVILVAKDNGNPQLSGHSFVTVRVLDEDDSPPVFDATHYEVSVPEDTKIGQIVKTVVTQDKDYGENARAYFFIAAGNDGRFQMTSEHLSNRSHGNLVVAKPLDFEVHSEYNLTVVASDKKFSAVTTITVKILDANDDPPYFQKSFYNTSLPENTPAGKIVLTVEATDSDSPASRLVYSLDDAASPYFSIVSTSGYITTSETPLDREKSPVLVFSVVVSDGANEARTFVEVTVLDVNEPPYFPNAPYIGFVEENKPKATSVLYVVALDDDDPKINNGANSKITYSIDLNTGQIEVDNDGAMFIIDSNTGLLSTDRIFNLENIRRNFTIHVRATDGGSPSLSTIVPVTIVIEDISEFPPKFVERVYKAEVSEDAVLGKVVVKLTVADEDFTFVGHRYSITSGNYPFAFYMRPESGEIIVAGILDYESKKEYNLTVAVSERNISKIFEPDHASVIIRILDANDHPPVFKPKTYYRKISEDVPPGTEIHVVTCSDGDDGANAIPTFSITGGNIDDSFEVMTHPGDKNLGVVKVSGKLDREKKSSYTLEITATDIGGMADTATLVVELDDVNDSPPRFTPLYYEGSISERVLKEQPVVTINATDSDLSPNGAPLTFTLNNFQDKFQLKNPNGQSVVLFTKMVEFTRETSPLYEVIVNASDNGSPKQSAEAMVFVNVMDGKSDQEPFDASMVIVVYALNGQFPGGTVGYVYYQDNDYQIDESEYSVVGQDPGSYFTVEESTGRIQCFDNIPDGEYTLNVSVREKNRDSGPNIGKTVLSQISVRVVSLNDTAVQQAVALRFPLRNPALFVNSMYMELIKILGDIFTVPSDHVYVFSIEKSSEGVADSSYGVDAWIAIRNQNGDGFIEPAYLFAQLEINYGKLVGLGTSNLEIGRDKCASESKSVGICKNILTAQNSFTVVSGYYGQVPAPSSTLTVVGVDTDLQDIYEVLPEPAPDCSTSPCKNGGICHNVMPQGYVCECPNEFRGPECQLTTRNFKRPDSYIWLKPMAAYELSSISFEFMSEMNIGNGLLLYQGNVQDNGNGMQDVLAVSLISGYITVVISLGGRAATFGLRQGDRLDDGKWHHVEVKRFKKEVRLIIDHCNSAITRQEDDRFFEDRTSCEVMSHSFENFIYLNSLGPLQVGGSFLSSFPIPTITAQSFYGCIRNIEDNGKMYDLRYPIKEHNAPTGCDRGCYSSPCQNGGFCEGEDLSSLSCCTCPVGYTGCDCSQRSPSLWYLENSFSEYNISSSLSDNASARKRRGFFSFLPGSSPKYYTNFVIRLRAAPDLRNAMVFYFSSSAGTSFSELGIKNKILYYTFKFADKIKTITLPGSDISDDKWHTVHIKQRGNTASLQLDFKAKAYGTTGGVIRLVEFAGGRMYIGGIPDNYENQKGGTIWSLDTHNNDEEAIIKVRADFQGCTAGTIYNGEELEKGLTFRRFHVNDGCPCTREVVDCENNGTCTDAEPPFCMCPKRFTGERCEKNVAIQASTQFQRSTLRPGLRSTGRHRMLDPVWICVFLMCLCILIFLLCLLHTLPVMSSEKPLIEEEAHDSIMAYQDHGVEEVDATGYDIKLLMKHSRQHVIRREVVTTTDTAESQTGPGSFEFDGNQNAAAAGYFGTNGNQEGHATIQGGEGSSWVNGEQTSDFAAQAGSGLIANSSRELAVQTSLGYGGEQGMDFVDSSGRLESWILERVVKANEGFRGFPEDEMNEIRDEARI